LIENYQRIPDYLWFDRESGVRSKYFNNFLNKNNIKLYHTENEGKAVVAERLIRTLKNKMWKQFTIQGNQKWNNNLLQKIVYDYNNNVHSSIKETPFKASENPKLVKYNNEENNNKNNVLKKKKPKFSIGDYVRIFRKKEHFEKGYTYIWTNEIFMIYRIYYTSPIMYSLKDLNGEEILGRFYKEELQKTTQKHPP